MSKPEIPADDLAEINELLSESLNGSRTPNDASAQRFMSALRAAERAGRTWPDAVIDVALYDWTFKRQKSLAKRESVVMVTHAGQQIGKATRVGKRVRRGDGTQGFQQHLISTFSWEELVEWGSLIASQIAGLEPNLTIVNALLPLRERCPDSYGPGDACQQIGTTVEEFLSEAAS